MRMASSTQLVVDTVRNFIVRHEYNEGRAFILSLEDSVTQVLEVSIVCANFYLGSGHPKWAEESLEKAGFEELISRGGALLDERIACMALLFAQVRKSRYYDYEKSFALALKVEDLYVHLKLEEFDDQSFKHHAVNVDRIRKQSQLWKAQNADEYDDIGTPISDLRIFIELWLFDIFFGQTTGCFMREADVDQKLRARIPPLIRFLRSRGRRAMEGECMFLTDVHRFLPEPLQAATFLQEYLGAIDDESHLIYKAVATARLSQYLSQSDPEAARLYLDESQRLCASQNCPNHLVSIDFVRIRDFQSATHSAANRVGQLFVLARRYRSLGDLSMQLKTVRLALDIVPFGLWDKVESMVDEVEIDLTSAGDMFKLLATRIVKLRVLAQNFGDSDETRQYLEGYLFDNPTDLTPDLYGTVCHALYHCYFTLGDFDLSVKFAEMESKSQVAQEYKYRMSNAIYHLVDARRSQINRSIELLGHRESQQRQTLIDSLVSAARELENWAEFDAKNNRWEQRSIKSRALMLIYHDINYKFCPEQGYSERYEFWMKESSPKDLTSPSQVSLPSIAAALIMFFTLKKYKEAVEFAEKAMVDFAADSNRSAHDMVIARFLVISSMQGAYELVKAESEETARLWRTKQLKWLLEDANVLKLHRSSEILLMHVVELCWVMKDFIEFYPEQRENSLAIMVRYFNDTDKICNDLRHTLKGGGLSQLLRKRTIVSKFNIRNFYEHAAQFFLQAKDETNAWYWLQRKRGQALLDMLAERSTAYDELNLAFKKDKTIEGFITKDDALVKEIAETDANNYFSAVEKLAEHRDEMKSIPALTGLLDGPVFSDPRGWDYLEDVWTIAEWLPENTNIVLIDWFVSPQNVVWWMSRDLKRKHLTPEWMQLSIGPVFIDRWIAKYLQFPNNRGKPLEREPRAAWKLRYLLVGLDKICKPGDLVILTPPAQFASIPIHAIPMENMPWIHRNTIIYSSSFSLYRECLKRSLRKSSTLNNAVFTAAYEESGYEEERIDIMKQVKACAEMFGSRTIMGADLTSDTLRGALTSAPWIHYHGHAYYERTEALKQSFILSPRIQSHGLQSGSAGGSEVVTGGANPIAEPIELASLKISESLPLPKALLSAHLLKDSSQLAVSDIFALNLSKTHPFVCSIACDSGLQDVAAGDEPLGLVTALFCAGASSVLGTLWPIQSSTGRSFANHFYRNIDRQRKVEEGKDTKVKVLNLALAVREASLEVKKEQGDPYSWAAFTLHGAGFYLYEL